MNYNTKLWKTIRWIGILPVAILAYVLSYLFFQFAYSLFADNDSLFEKYLIAIISSATSGFIYILAGSFVAPSNKITVSLTLLILVLLLAGVEIFIDIFNKRYFELFELVVSLIGSTAGYFASKSQSS